jgi:hypothetical protein
MAIVVRGDAVIDVPVWLELWTSNRIWLPQSWLVASVAGSGVAGPLVVGPSVELLCCSTSGSWDSNTGNL